MNHSAIQNLLDRYLSGACSAEEQLIVEKWLEQQQETSNEWSEMDAPAKAAWMSQLHQDIQHTIHGSGMAATTRAIPANATRALPIYRRLLFRASVAAAVILLIAGVWWFERTPAHEEGATVHNSRPSNDVPPGGNRAILTLANGSTIALDSAANGSLAQQGNTTVLKTANGQLAYQIAASDKPQATRAATYNTLATPRGGQYRLVLPDGSKVWLNAASSIRYPTTFEGKERRVTITGEAYFEIKENAALPFVVATDNKGEIQVLGTQFNVNAYDDEPVVKTTLLEGAVQVKKEGTTLLLKPGEQAQLTKTGDLTRMKDVDMEETIAWKNGKFSCKNMALEDILRQVARWYDVEIVYEDRITDRYTASVARDVPVSSLLRYLELSEGVHFRIEGRKITVVK